MCSICHCPFGTFLPIALLDITFSLYQSLTTFAFQKSHSRASGNCFDFEDFKDFEGDAFFFVATFFFFPFLGPGCSLGSDPSTCTAKSWVANPTVSLAPVAGHVFAPASFGTSSFPRSKSNWVGSKRLFQ